MHLFTNGCSFTWGGAIIENELGLPDTMSQDDENSVFRYRVVWPFKLHEITGSETITNPSMGCGSNDRIVRTTLSHFTDMIRRGKDLSTHIAIIQWTEPCRFEVHDSIEKTWLLIKPGVVIPPVDRHRKDHFHERMAEDDVTHDQNLFKSMVTLSSFFDKWGIRYLFTSMVPISFSDDGMMSYCRTHMNWFNGMDSSLATITSHPDLCYDSSHPNPKGHRKIAALMYEQLYSMEWV